MSNKSEPKEMSPERLEELRRVATGTFYSGPCLATIPNDIQPPILELVQHIAFKDLEYQAGGVHIENLAGLNNELIARLADSLPGDLARELVASITVLKNKLPAHWKETHQVTRFNLQKAIDLAEAHLAKGKGEVKSDAGQDAPGA